MAYLNYLASVSPTEVSALRADASVQLKPSLLVAVSHLIGYWVQVQPLGRLLGQALDGGTILNSELWHSLRSPIYHEPEAVQSLFADLNQAWLHTLASHPVPEDDWYRVEIEKVLRLFRHAAEGSECVVSVLQAPADRERADRIHNPLITTSRAL